MASSGIIASYYQDRDSIIANICATRYYSCYYVHQCMSALARLHQEGVPGNAAQSAGAPGGSKQVQGRSASESGHAACVLLTAARVSSITRHRAAVLRVMQGEARAARAGEAVCAWRCCCCCVGGRQGKTEGRLRDAVLSILFTD